MKPFNLQEALAGKPVVTRDGRPVKIADYNKLCKSGKVLMGWVENEPYVWTENGFNNKNDISSGADLFMAPTERKEWVVRVVNRVDYEMQNGTSFMDGVTELTGFSSLESANAYKDKIDALNIATKVSIHEITIIE